MSYIQPTGVIQLFKGIALDNRYMHTIYFGSEALQDAWFTNKYNTGSIATPKKAFGYLLKLIIIFTLPLVLGNLLQQLYQMADTYIISQTIGVEAFAAVGSTNSINVLVLGLAIGLTSGLSVITAQRFGKKDEKGI